MSDQLKNEFEKWAESRCYYLDKYEDGKYVRPTTALAWEIWRVAQPKVNRNKDKLDNQLADEGIRILQAAGYESIGCGIANEIFSLKDHLTKLQLENDELRLMLSGATLQIQMMALELKGGKT